MSELYALEKADSPFKSCKLFGECSKSVNNLCICKIHFISPSEVHFTSNALVYSGDSDPYTLLCLLFRLFMSAREYGTSWASWG